MEGLLLHAQKQEETRAVYLHVESTNNIAITFYERKGFHYFTTVLGYYFLEGSRADGVVYVMFMNGGKCYQGGLKNWYKRYVKSRSLGQCFSRVYDCTFELLKNVFFDQDNSTYVTT